MADPIEKLDAACRLWLKSGVGLDDIKKEFLALTGAHISREEFTPAMEEVFRRLTTPPAPSAR